MQRSQLVCSQRSVALPEQCDFALFDICGLQPVSIMGYGRLDDFMKSVIPHLRRSDEHLWIVTSAIRRLLRVHAWRKHYTHNAARSANGTCTSSDMHVMAFLSELIIYSFLAKLDCCVYRCVQFPTQNTSVPLCPFDHSAECMPHA